MRDGQCTLALLETNGENEAAGVVEGKTAVSSYLLRIDFETATLQANLLLSSSWNRLEKRNATTKGEKVARGDVLLHNLSPTNNEQPRRVGASRDLTENFLLKFCHNIFKQFPCTL